MIKYFVYTTLRTQELRLYVVLPFYTSCIWRFNTYLQINWKNIFLAESNYTECVAWRDHEEVVKRHYVFSWSANVPPLLGLFVVWGFSLYCGGQTKVYTLSSHELSPEKEKRKMVEEKFPFSPVSRTSSGSVRQTGLCDKRQALQFRIPMSLSTHVFSVLLFCLILKNLKCLESVKHFHWKIKLKF